MNLHIIPDDKYVTRFIERIGLLGLSDNNTFVVKAPKPFKYLSQSLNGASPTSQAFKDLVANPNQYEKIFMHFLDEDSMNIILDNNWQKVHWIAWGGDVYESLYGSLGLVDAATEALMQVTLRNRLNRFVYSTAEKILKRKKFREAYSRISHMCCWVKEEYDFAKDRFPGLTAEFRPFIYEGAVSFERLQAEIPEVTVNKNTGKVKILLGQSTMLAGNHMSALTILRAKNSVAEVFIPASYGSPAYLDRLEKTTQESFPFVVTYMKEFQTFTSYVNFVMSLDVVILHSRRPAGLGNFWIGIFLGKMVFLRRENMAFQILQNLGLKFFALDEWNETLPGLSLVEIHRNRKICLEFFSDERIGVMYNNLFR